MDTIGTRRPNLSRERTSRRGSLSGAGSEDMVGDGSSGMAADSLPAVLFDGAHESSKKLQQFKQLQKKFKNVYRFVSSRDALTWENLQQVKCVVFVAPTKGLTEQDATILHKFMENGGRVLLMAGESGEPSMAHLDFTSAYGITIQDNAVVRTVYHRDCFHPKEVFVRDAAISESFSKFVKQFRPPVPSSSLGATPSAPALPVGAGPPGTSVAQLLSDSAEPVSIVYPYGCSLKVVSPAVPILTSGTFSLPSNAAIVAATRVGAGLLVVAGSSSLFDDEYFGKADNAAFSAALFAILTDDKLEVRLGDGFVLKPAPATAAVASSTMGPLLGGTNKPPSRIAVPVAETQKESQSGPTSLLNRLRSTVPTPETSAQDTVGVDLSVDPDVPEMKSEWQTVPDIAALAERLRPCLAESEELPSDFNRLFDTTMFKLDTVSLIPQIVQMHSRLGVTHEPLALVPPVFDVPLPPLQPAVFMPLLREPAPPVLDLFDLDEQFASEKLRLAQLTNKCTENDVEYYIQESANILGITEEVKSHKAATSGKSPANVGRPTAKDILAFVLARIVDMKRLEPTGGVQPQSSSSGSSASTTAPEAPAAAKSE